VHRIDPESVSKVRVRVDTIDVTNRGGPGDVLRAFKAIDCRLAADNTRGHLYQGDGTEILCFPGCEKTKPLTFGVFN